MCNWCEYRDVNWCNQDAKFMSKFNHQQDFLHIYHLTIFLKYYLIFNNLQYNISSILNFSIRICGLKDQYEKNCQNVIVLKLKKFSKYIPKIWYLSMGVQIFKWISKEHFKFLQWNFTFFKENLKGILKKYIHVTNTLIMTLFRGIRFFFLDDTFYHIDLSNHIY